MEDKKAMSRRELVKEISEVTQLKTEVVKNVLNVFGDIFIRECVMNGKFNFNNGFSVNTHSRKARKQYNVSSDKYIDYPETEVLSIKLSPKINKFHRWKMRNSYNEKNNLKINDWEDMKK